MKNDIKKVAKNVYVVPYKTAKAVVSFGSDASDIVDASLDIPENKNKRNLSDHIPRGNGDSQLLDLHHLASNNPAKWQLIFTKSDFVGGSGLATGFYEIKGNEEILTPTIDQALKDWIESLGLEDLRAGAAMQLSFAEEFYVRVELGIDKKLKDVSIVDVFEIRPRKIAKGDTSITEYVLNPNFGTKRFKKAENVYLPAFDPKEPTKYPVSIFRVARPNIPGQKIFSLAPWWGTSDWTKVANKVPIYNDKGLDNGYFITHHFSIPDDYFADKQFDTEEEEEAYKRSVLDSMADTLSGYENPNKTLFTFHKSDSMGRELPGVKITPLKSTINDEAFVKLYNTAAQAQIQGHGIPAALAGIETGGKLGGSGKELEASANYLQDFLTLEHRRLIERCIRRLQLIDGVSTDKHVFIKRIKTYTYDVTPTASIDNPNNPVSQNAN